MLAFTSYSNFSLSLLKCDPQKTIQNPTWDTVNAGLTKNECLQAVISSQSPSVIFKQTASLCSFFSVTLYMSCS